MKKVKEDFNIDELFKQKFENFESNVDPSVWANISQGIGAGGAGGAGAGLSGLAKVAIIAGAAAVTSFGLWYFTSDSSTEDLAENSTTNTVEDLQIQDKSENTVVVEDKQIVDQNAEPIATEETTVYNEDANDHENRHVNNLNDSNVSNDGSQSVNDGSDQRDPIVTDPVNDQTANEKEDQQQSNEAGPIEVKKLESEMIVSLKGKTLSFDSKAKNQNAVKWDFGDGTTSNLVAGIHEYKVPGTYRVIMEVSGNENGAGQVDLDSRLVTVEGTSEISRIPNIFTPNYDGDNDTWSIDATEMKVFTVMVQDSRGEIVFESNDPNFEWNGDDKSGNQVTGRCAYVISAVGMDGQSIKRSGMITISR